MRKMNIGNQYSLGYKHTQSAKDTISRTSRERWQDIGYREKVGKVISDIIKDKWLNDKQYKENRLKGVARILFAYGQNKAEKKLEIFLNILLPNTYKFVGNGKIFIAGKVPDFIHTKKKKIIELFGEYWHEKSDVLKRKKHFRKYGFKTLIIWLKEMRRAETREKLKRKILYFELH